MHKVCINRVDSLIARLPYFSPYYLRTTRPAGTKCQVPLSVLRVGARPFDMVSKEGHLERTAKEPRHLSLHEVTIKQIDQINSSVRLFRLGIPNNESIKFLPGQWLDVYVPTVPQAGGFTITSPPSKALPLLPSSDRTSSTYPYLELAIQKSPLNPPAAWLWQEPATTSSLPLDATIRVRVGGTFVYPPFPPHGDDERQHRRQPVKRVVFIAGGVGINPLVSMLSFIAELDEGKEGLEKPEVHFLYSAKDPDPDVQLENKSSQILFLDRIAGLFFPLSSQTGQNDGAVSGRLDLFITGTRTAREEGYTHGNDPNMLSYLPCLDGRVRIPFHQRRIARKDVFTAVGRDKHTSVVYVCGVPTMTDEFVRILTLPEESGGLGMEADRVLFEKWW